MKRDNCWSRESGKTKQTLMAFFFKTFIHLFHLFGALCPLPLKAARHFEMKNRNRNKKPSSPNQSFL